MVVNERTKAMADKYIYDTYNNPEIACFDISSETNETYCVLRDKIMPADMPFNEKAEIERLAIACTDAFLEQGIYYGLLHASEILKAAKELQEATR